MGQCWMKSQNLHTAIWNSNWNPYLPSSWTELNMQLKLCLAFKRHCPSISLCFFACVSPSFSLCLSGYMVSEVYVSDMQNSNRRIIQWIKSKEYPAPLWQQSKYSDAQCFTKMSTAWKITVLKPASSVHGAPVLSGRRSQILSVSM